VELKNLELTLIFIKMRKFICNRLVFWLRIFFAKIGGRVCHWFPMQDYSIERQGTSNLDFTGEIIGQSSDPNPAIKIYRTAAQKFIGQWGANLKMSQAQHFDNPTLLITWFRQLNEGFLRSDAQDAIEMAASKDDAFKAAWNEHID
jgi:hypothetical protein